MQRKHSQISSGLCVSAPERPTTAAAAVDGNSVPRMAVFHPAGSARVQGPTTDGGVGALMMAGVWPTAARQQAGGGANGARRMAAAREQSAWRAPVGAAHAEAVAHVRRWPNAQRLAVKPDDAAPRLLTQMAWAAASQAGINTSSTKTRTQSVSVLRPDLTLPRSSPLAGGGAAWHPAAQHKLINTQAIKTTRTATFNCLMTATQH